MEKQLNKNRLQNYVARVSSNSGFLLFSWYFLSLFIYFAFTFIYFKTYKYNYYIRALRVKIKTLSSLKQVNVSFYNELAAFVHMYYEDIIVALALSLLMSVFFLFRKTLAGKFFKFLFVILSVFVFLVMVGDSQVFKKFGVSINWELLTFSFAFPEDLMKSNDGSATFFRSMRYLFFFIFSSALLVYIIYSKSFLKRLNKMITLRRTKIISIFLLSFLLLLSLVRFTSKPGRILSGLDRNFMTIIIKDIFAAKSKITPRQEKIIKKYVYQKGAFTKATGLKTLSPQKTNVIIILLESTSYKYMTLKKYRKKIFPFLSKLMKDKSSILVKRFYAPIPRSCKARVSIVTGEYVRPEGYYRLDEKYKFISLPKFFNRQGYSSYYLHTCDLNFDHQRQYFSKLDYKVWDSKWFVSHNAGKEYKAVGWGFDDRLLNSKAMEEIYKKHLKSRGAKEDTPFFVVFSMIDSHHPYAYPRGFKIPHSLRKLKMRRSQKRYIKSLYFSDSVARDLYESLKKEKILDNTLLIVLGDHGESFREHGYEIHNFSIFNEEIQVPFFFSYPGFVNSKVHSLEMGSELDIFPTVLDILGEDGKFSFAGFSLFNQKEKRTVYLNSWTNAINIGKVFGKKKYIYNSFNDDLNLYDMIKDPFERKPFTIKGKKKEKIVADLKLARKVISYLHVKSNYYGKKGLK